MFTATMLNKLKYNCIGFDELVLWSLTQWVLITHILNITLSYDLSVIMTKHIYDWRNIRYVCLWSFLEYKHCSNNKLAVSMNDMPRICVAISPGDTPLTDCLHPCDKVQIISQQPALKTWLLHIFLGGTWGWSKITNGEDWKFHIGSMMIGGLDETVPPRRG